LLPWFSDSCTCWRLSCLEKHLNTYKLTIDTNDKNILLISYLK
jgi:hypothetical protein